jgi:tetratricopeptide (TPR) repeat protein
MRIAVIFLFYFSISYSQEMEVIHSVTQKLTRVKHGSMNMPQNTISSHVKEYNQRIEENECDWQAYLMRAKANKSLFNFRASIEDTKVLIKHNQELKIAYWIQGESYVNLSEYENAIQAYKKALKYYDAPYTIARINFFIGMCFMQINREEDACVYFEKMGHYRFHDSFKAAAKYCQ